MSQKGGMLQVYRYLFCDLWFVRMDYSLLPHKQHKVIFSESLLSSESKLVFFFRFEGQSFVRCTVNTSSSFLFPSSGFALIHSHQ